MKTSSLILHRLSLSAALNRCLTSRNSPTADLYFRNACQDRLTNGSIKQFSPTVFASASTQLVIRHDARAPVGLNRERLVYFIDDLWNFGDQNPGLSWFYFNKMQRVEGNAASWYMKRADAVVVSTAKLAEIASLEAPQAKIFQIDPYWSEPLANSDHFDNAGFDIAYLGSQVHSADLAFLFPVIRRILDKIPEATFSLSSGHRIPADINRHPRINRINALRWPEYRAALVNRRFHAALYPLLDTAFNRGRSINKIIEHAVVGAVGLYSDWWLRENNWQQLGLGLPNTVDKWVDALLDVATNNALYRERFKAREKLIEFSSATRSKQREVWSSVL